MLIENRRMHLFSVSAAVCPLFSTLKQIITMTASIYQYINLDYLNLMTDGDNDMKQVMLDMLFEELPQELEKMNQLHTESAWEELKAVSHKMKSTMSFVGNKAMTEANREVEAILKDGGDKNKIAGLLATLNEYQPKVLTELKIEYNKL